MNKTAQDMQKKYQQAGIPIYRRAFFSTVVVILASCCDFITIYSVSQELLTERPVITVAITGAVAFILNFLPALLGNAIADKNTKNRKILSIILIIAFTILFILTFLLRWTSRDMLFADTSDLNIFKETNTELSGTTPAQNVLTILIGSSTLFTSILSFVFSVLTISREEMLSNLKRMRRVELEEKRDACKAHISELDQIIKSDAEEKRDELAYENMQKKMEGYREYFKELARIALMEYIHSAEAANIVLQREPPIA